MLAYTERQPFSFFCFPDFPPAAVLFLKRKKVEKNFLKNLEVILESPYLCTRFQKWSGVGWNGFPEGSVGMFSLPFLFSLSQERWRERGVEKKIKKTSEKIWKLCLKVLTFASAFGNEAGRQDRSAIFEDIYINNTSSTRARLQHQDEVTLGIRKNRQYL